MCMEKGFSELVLAHTKPRDHIFIFSKDVIHGNVSRKWAISNRLRDGIKAQSRIFFVVRVGDVGIKIIRMHSFEEFIALTKEGHGVVEEDVSFIFFAFSKSRTAIQVVKIKIRSMDISMSRCVMTGHEKQELVHIRMISDVMHQIDRATLMDGASIKGHGKRSSNENACKNPFDVDANRAFGERTGGIIVG